MAILPSLQFICSDSINEIHSCFWNPHYYTGTNHRITFFVLVWFIQELHTRKVGLCDSTSLLWLSWPYNSTIQFFFMVSWVTSFLSFNQNWHRFNRKKLHLIQNYEYGKYGCHLWPGTRMTVPTRKRKEHCYTLFKLFLKEYLL